MLKQEIGLGSTDRVGIAGYFRRTDAFAYSRRDKSTSVRYEEEICLCIGIGIG